MIIIRTSNALVVMNKGIMIAEIPRWGNTRRGGGEAMLIRVAETRQRPEPSPPKPASFFASNRALLL